MRNKREMKYESGKASPSPKGAGVETGLSEHYECEADNNTLDYDVESAKQQPAMESAADGFEFKGN